MEKSKITQEAEIKVDQIEQRNDDSEDKSLLDDVIDALGGG